MSQFFPVCISVIILLLDSGRSVHIREGRGDLMGKGDRVRLKYLPGMIAGIRPDRLTACAASESTSEGSGEVSIDSISALH